MNKFSCDLVVLFWRKVKKKLSRIKHHFREHKTPSESSSLCWIAAAIKYRPFPVKFDIPLTRKKAISSWTGTQKTKSFAQFFTRPSCHFISKWFERHFLSMFLFSFFFYFIAQLIFASSKRQIRIVKDKKREWERKSERERVRDGNEWASPSWIYKVNRGDLIAWLDSYVR